MAGPPSRLGPGCDGPTRWHPQATSSTDTTPGRGWRFRGLADRHDYLPRLGTRIESVDCCVVRRGWRLLTTHHSPHTGFAFCISHCSLSCGCRCAALGGSGRSSNASAALEACWPNSGRQRFAGERPNRKANLVVRLHFGAGLVGRRSDSRLVSGLDERCQHARRVGRPGLHGGLGDLRDLDLDGLSDGAL